MRWCVLVVMAGTSWACAQQAATRPTSAPAATQPAWPVAYRHEVRKDPPLHLHVLTVDLTDPRVSVVARPGGADPDGPLGPWATTLMATRAVAQRDGLAAAVNGDFFSPKDVREILGRRVPYFGGNWARPVGPAVADGRAWAAPLNVDWPCLVVTGERQLSLARRAADVPPNARQVVGGSTILVRDGAAVAKGEPPAPRTAAGVDKAGTRLTLVVVDGRRTSYSAGMTLDELANEMVKLGCDWAINLDGGGSSTMVVRDPATGLVELKNRPSDGHDFVLPLSVERPVAGVLGVVVKPEGGNQKSESSSNEMK